MRAISIIHLILGLALTLASRAAGRGLRAEEPVLRCGQTFHLEPSALFRLSSGTAAPGGDVRLSLFVTPDYELNAFTAVMDFNEEVLEVRAIEQVYLAGDLDWTGLAFLGFVNSNVHPGNSGVCDEGFIVVRPSGFGELDDRGRTIRNLPLPAGQETEFVSILFRVKGDAPAGVTEVRFENCSPDPRLPPAEDKFCNGVQGENGGGAHTMNVIHGAITIEGPTVESPAPRHSSLGGLGDRVTTIVPADELDAIAAVAPAGDVDGDGRDDILLRRTRHGAPGVDDGESVGLLYGSVSPAGTLDPFRESARKTVLRIGATRLNRPDGLGGGEDIDGDGFDDFLVVTGTTPARGPALLLVHGGNLPASIGVEEIGGSVRGSVIRDSSPPDPDELVGRLSVMSPDLNGDGRPDLAIAETADLLTRRRVHVLFGSSALPASIELQDIGSMVPGFVIEAAGLGLIVVDDVVPLGDVDGDGLADLGVAAERGSTGAPGRYLSFILFGATSFESPVVLGALAPGEAVRFPGYEQMARGGDVDGDGLEDPVFFQLRGEGENAEAHVVRGRPREAMPAEITVEGFHADDLGLALVEARDAFGIDSPLTGPRLNLTGGMDVDGDGKAEVFLAANERTVNYRYAGAFTAGAAFIARGGALSGSMGTNLIADRRGARLDGIDPGGVIGFRLFVLRDFDGDGSAELLLVSRRDACEALEGKPALRGHDFKLWLVPTRHLLGEGGAPRLERIHPARGSLAGGGPVVLFGRGFGGSPRVDFGGKAARVLEVFGDGLVAVEAPPSPLPLAVPVAVTNPRGKTAEEVAFTYFAGGENVLDVTLPTPRALAIRHSRPFPGDARGMAVGDFDGDGDPDLAIASFAGSAGAPNGLYYSIQLVLGDGTRGAPVDLDALAPGQGATIWAPLYMGFLKADGASSLRSGGDVNGDGIQDLLFSASVHGEQEWDLFLGLEGYPPEATLSEMVDLRRFPSTQPSFDTGTAGSIVPDLDGDGLDDLLLTGIVYQPTERHLYIIRGQRALPDVVDLSTAAQDGQGALYRTRLDLSLAAGAAGDFNGDGRPDVFFGGNGRIAGGAVLILYGGESMFPGAPVVLGADHMRDAGGLLVTGASVFSGYTFSAAAPGDLDGDGKGDLFVGLDNTFGCTLAPGSGLGFVLDREAILRQLVTPEEFPVVGQLYGDEPTGLPDAVLGSAASPEGVLALRGTLRGDSMGSTSSPAGDFNGDGLDDLLVGSAVDETGVLFGAPDIKEQAIDLPDLLGRALTIRGPSEFLAGGFDWDADGVQDIALGSSRGDFFIVFGERRTEGVFVRGEVNSDGTLNLSDPIAILGFLFLGSFRPACPDALDADDDGLILITDAIYLLSYLFLGGRSPPEPFLTPGPDPTADGLGCGP